MISAAIPRGTAAGLWRPTLLTKPLNRVVCNHREDNLTSFISTTADIVRYVQIRSVVDLVRNPLTSQSSVCHSSKRFNV
jgi:hypothetical protein